MLYKLLPVVTAVAAERFLTIDEDTKTITVTAHGLTDGDLVLSESTGGKCGVADATYFIAKVTDVDNFKLQGVQAHGDADGKVAGDGNDVAVSDATDCTYAEMRAIKLNVMAASADSTSTALDATTGIALAGDIAADLTAGRAFFWSAHGTSCDEDQAGKLVSLTGYKVKEATDAGTSTTVTVTDTSDADVAPATDADCAGMAYLSNGTVLTGITNVTEAPTTTTANNASSFNVVVATVASGFLYLLM